MSPGRRARLLWRRLFHTALVEAGYKPNILFRSADTESILMMVSAEEGVSLLPDYCTNRFYNADNIVFVPLVGEGEEEEIIAAWQSGNKNPALGRFLAELNQKGVKRGKILLYRDRQTFRVEKAVNRRRGRDQNIRRFISHGVGKCQPNVGISSHLHFNLDLIAKGGCVLVVAAQRHNGGR